MAVVFATLAACASASPEAAQPTASEPIRTAIYEGNGYSFAYPAEWKPRQPVTGYVDVVIMARPAAREGGVVPNINVVLEPLRVEVTTDEYFDASKAAVESAFHGFDLLDEGRVLIDGNAARWIEYEWESENGRLHQRQAYVVKGKTAYVITFTASADGFDEHVSSQLQVEKTLRFDD
jgi:hypothetical protein